MLEISNWNECNIIDCVQFVILQKPVEAMSMSAILGSLSKNHTWQAQPRRVNMEGRIV